MNTDMDAVAALLNRAEHVHAAAFESVNGEDPNWATFYADWLLGHSSLSSMVGGAPTSVSLAAILAQLDERYVSEKPDEAWESYYAKGLIEHFGSTRTV